MIGAKGVERIIEIDLNKAERAMFDKSLASVEGLVEGLHQDRTDARQVASSRGRGRARAQMNIHEYQAKAILQGYGAPVLQGVAIFSAGEADKAARELGGPLWVVKSQIHAGGRGKGKFKEASAGEKGGVRLARSIDEVKDFAGQMLGATLVTKQTGPHGRVVRRLYIEAGSDIDRELYLSCLVDRAVGKVAFIVSQAGGMDIEEVAHKTPEKIATVHVDRAQPRHQRGGGQGRRRAGAQRRSRRAVQAAGRGALPGLRRQGHEPP